MCYEEEIQYRDRVLAKVRSGKKLTTEDRLWLATHRIINRQLGYPYLNTDIIHLRPKTNYIIRITVENLKYTSRIIPVITVPGGKGKIVTSKSMTDYCGKVPLNREVKMLGLLVDLNHSETELIYQSDLGLLGISYECDYFDDKQQLMLRKNSCVGDTSFAMLSEIVSENKIIYRCKAPMNSTFEAFVFAIEWAETADSYSMDKRRT